jgi:enterochelin esterase family protein
MARIEGTDVWYASVEADPRTVVPYQFQVDPPSWGATLEEVHALLADEERLAAFMRALFVSGRADPHNPERHYPYNALFGGDPDGTAGEDKWESILTLPAAEQLPYLDGQGLHGRLEHHVLAGKALPGERAVTIYLPPDYRAETAYPLVVLLDGELLLKCARLDTVLDSAIAQGAIPPVVAVFWHNLTIASRMTEMACNPALPDALADELLPWVRANYGVTDDPSQVVIGGQSFGGLSSAWIPFRRWGAFGAAFIVSPSFWFTPPDVGEVAAEVPGGWLTQQYEAADAKLVRMYIAVGTLESSPIPYPGMNGQSMVDLARNFRDAVRARGHDIAGYREEPGGHNHVTMRRLLVPGLNALLAEPSA